MVGQTISHYRIVEKLGEGGMGVVYKAEDLKLGRLVALKFLPSHLLESEEHKARFLHEARTAALLDHPNICTVYEIDEVEGRALLAMTCLEGQTLKRKIAERPLPLDEALGIALQIGQGLHAAHEKTIVHRDIKPANVMIAPQGQVKIMDFGLALLSNRTRLTVSGMKLGTPAYMSPEQTQGKSTDRRSDIWALGVVLYEMVSGRLPFAGDAEPALAYAILHTDPEPLTALRSGIPVELDRISAKALAKEPAERYQHVDEMLTDLQVLRRSLAEGTSRRPAALPAVNSPARRYASLGAGVLLMLLAAFGFWFLRPAGSPVRAPGPTERVRIAVLPLDNLSGAAEQDYFSDGMTDALISELGAIGALRVTSWTSVARYKQSKPPLPRIAAELGVTHVLEGAVLQTANQVRISARLIAAESDEQLWAKTFERGIEDVLALQREVARTVVSEIGVQLDPRLQARLQSAPPANREAYTAYLQGVQYLFLEPAKALESFQKAVEIDPDFSLARASLALSYSQGGPGSPLARTRIELGRRAAEEARRALELDENNEVAYNALGWVHSYFEYDWTAAERAFQRALELNPSSADANHRYSHYLMMMGQIEEALQVSHRARELNPFSPAMVAHHVWTLYMARRYEEAVQYAESILQADPTNFAARRYSYPAYAQLRRFEPVLSVREPAWVTLADLVQAHAFLGDEKSAREILAKMLPSNNSSPHLGAYRISLAYVALGDTGEALDWIEKAYETRAFPLPEISIDVRFDSLRGQERFEKLLAKMGLRNAWREP